MRKRYGTTDKINSKFAVIKYRIRLWFLDNWIHIAISSTLALIMLVLAVVNALSIYRFSVEASQSYEISSSQDFYELRKTHEIIDTVSLKCNIEIKNNEPIGDVENPFNAHFNGGGYKITVLESTEDESLFGIIGDKGSVENLEVEYKATTLERDSFGFLSKINNGTIKNIKLELNDINIRANIALGGLCTINNGTIANCYIEGNIINHSSSSVATPIIGGCCAINNGVVDSIISRTTLANFKQTDPNYIIHGVVVNNTIGSVQGLGNNGSRLENSYYIYPDKNVYLSDMKIARNLFLHVSSFDENTLLNDFHFSNKLWRIEIDENDVLNYTIELKDGVWL